MATLEPGVSQVRPRRSSRAARSRRHDPLGIALGTVLYPCDFSEASADALGVATALAAAYGARLVALHVIPSRMPPSGGFRALPNPSLLRPHLHEEVSRALEGLLQPARAAALKASSALREGGPAEEILKLASALPAGAVVLGTHGRGAVDRAILGSVAETVLRSAPCPVLAVPPGFRAAAGGWPRTVLWATDFSAGAQDALPYALSVASRTGARLVAVHVLDCQPRHRPRCARSAARRLEAMLPPRPGDERVVLDGVPADEILALAARAGAGMIVTGASGRGALGRIVFGSTARAVVRASACPVLVVRPA
jgi:nucleotide-binding universal stress UspA family protein